MAYADKTKNAQYINGYMKANYDRIAVMRPKGQREKIKAIARERGQGLNEFINGVLDAYFEQNGIIL